MFPECGQHDYCRYCNIPCFAGESFEEQADGSYRLNKIQGDGCMVSQIRMELCQQIEQGIDPLGGKSVEECLAALMSQLGDLTDSIVLGHLVSPDVLSVFRIRLAHTAIYGAVEPLRYLLGTLYNRWCRKVPDTGASIC